MLKACIFPKSLTKWGRSFKSMNCGIFYSYDQTDILITKSNFTVYILFAFLSVGEWHITIVSFLLKTNQLRT